MLEYIEKLPEDVSLSPDLREKALGYFKILLFGLYYYFPITKELKQMFKIKIENGHFVWTSFKAEEKVENLLRHLLLSTYYQVRDTVGKEVYRDINRNIKDGLEKMYTGILQKSIIGNLDSKMLPSGEK